MRPISSSPILMSKNTLLVMRGPFVARTTLARKRSARSRNDETPRRSMAVKRVGDAVDGYVSRSKWKASETNQIGLGNLRSDYRYR